MAKAQQWPAVRRVTLTDLAEVIGQGIMDLRTAPRLGLALGLLYASAGWLLVALVWKLGAPFLAYPLAMGFALIAPFAAVGFYAVSDHLEKGQAMGAGNLWRAVKGAAARDLRWMALVTGFALVIWMDIAAFLFFALMGFNSFGPDLVKQLLTTPTGLAFTVLGNAAGALIAFAIFSISVVSFPMLYERDVDFVTAMVTSVRLVIANPVTMATWCATIAMLVGLSILSAFVGLIVVLPIVGHATWHLYRRAVAPPEPASPAPAAAAA